jgi:lysophospholipase L1-like esterase
MAFEKACEDNDIIFVDMTDDFKQLYEEKNILPYGFINTKVGRGHLNKYGHMVIAKKLAQVIKEEGQ